MDFLRQVIDLLPTVANPLLQGVEVTLFVTAVAFLISLVVGLLVAVLRLMAALPIRILVGAYVEVMRVVPVLTVLFIFFFGLASLGVVLDPFTAGFLGLGLWGSAYLSEIYRAGIEDVDRGQTDAGRALGLSEISVMTMIVIPQAIRVVLPAIVNFAIGLLKYSSVASAIGVLDLLYHGRALMEITFKPLHLMLMVAIIYLALSLPLSGLAAYLQKSLQRHRTQVTT